MSLFDNPATIPTLSAHRGLDHRRSEFNGQRLGRQRHRERRELVAKKMAQLEQLYSDFINESARLLVDAVQHSLENPGMLAPLYALLSRIRLSSSTDVIESGERVIATILKTYFEPNLSPEDIQSVASKHNDHLQEFSTVCRRELESLGKRF